MRFQAAIANGLWAASNVAGAARFQRALAHPRESQLKLLQQCIKANARSSYGKKHRFGSLAGYEAFREAVPVVSYEDLAPWIERIVDGESAVLTEERVLHLAPTSGSVGARKLIPFTAGLQRAFNRALGPWMLDLARCYPGILLGPAYWSITPAVSYRGQCSTSVPIGFDEDSAYLGGARKRLVDAAMTVPSALRLVHDVEAFKYLTCLCLLRCRDLRLISVWHPSYLILLLDTLKTRWDDLVADLGEGKCQRGGRVPELVVTKLRLRPMAARANELRRLGPADAEALWLQLKLISCWGGGHATAGRLELKRRFPHVAVQAKGLLATEAFVTIPFQGGYPLAVESHFFEFADADGRFRLGDELELGREYEVIVTNGGGLWRYRLGDRVRIIGFIGKTPSLEFIGRAGCVSDRRGEKLTEGFASAAIRELISGLDGPPRFAMLAPDRHSSDSWGYTLYIEGDIPETAACGLDAKLKANPQYAWCRDLGQLGPPRIFKIEARGFESFAAAEMAHGKRLGDIKPCALSLRDGWSERFTGRYLALE